MCGESGMAAETVAMPRQPNQFELKRFHSMSAGLVPGKPCAR
jgi:hypothetical protein